ncbi:MAG TPA: acetyltransferase, partial [Candidatus Melainabacteria bacterium]|nr:acetyltransferase [Candidatus Melainabacteria bacterium]
VGAGGHSTVVADAISQDNMLEILCFIDPNRSGQREKTITLKDAERLEPGLFIVAIGSNKIREQRYNQMTTAGWTAHRVIHPSAIVSEEAQIGAGTFVGAGAIINSHAIIGENCIINTGAIIEHHCVVLDHSHISPGAVLGGAVKIGRFVQVSLGAVVLPERTIGDSSILGAGSVLTRNLDSNKVSYGSPAKVRRST